MHSSPFPPGRQEKRPSRIRLFTVSSCLYTESPVVATAKTFDGLIRTQDKFINRYLERAFLLSTRESGGNTQLERRMRFIS